MVLLRRIVPLREGKRTCPLPTRRTVYVNLRFSMPVTVLGRLRKRSRGGKGYKVGELEVSHVRGQAVELVNLGEAGRVKGGRSDT
jgi:hypothetical protein